MDNLLKLKNLSWTALVGGALGFGLHRLALAVAVDGKNLPVANHPLELLLWVLTAGVLALTLAGSWREKPAGKQPALPAAAVPAEGQLFLGTCLLLTVLTKTPELSGIVGTVWKCLGALGGVLLITAGIRAQMGKKPLFAAHLVLCLFFSVHIVTHYQTWSGDPQLQHYIFVVLGQVALVFTAYYQTAAEVGLGRQWIQPLTGLLTVYLCTVSLMDTRFPLLQLGGIFWTWCALQGEAPKEVAP